VAYTAVRPLFPSGIASIIPYVIHTYYVGMYYVGQDAIDWTIGTSDRSRPAVWPSGLGPGKVKGDVKKA
jgi:hypothetical protein